MNSAPEPGKLIQFMQLIRGDNRFREKQVGLAVICAFTVSSEPPTEALRNKPRKAKNHEWEFEMPSIFLNHAVKSGLFKVQ